MRLAEHAVREVGKEVSAVMGTPIQVLPPWLQPDGEGAVCADGTSAAAKAVSFLVHPSMPGSAWADAIVANWAAAHPVEVERAFTKRDAGHDATLQLRKMRMDLERVFPFLKVMPAVAPDIPQTRPTP